MSDFINSDSTSARDSEQSDFAGRSSLYREYLAEREEVLRHKWIESEKVGRDIGFERALVDWIHNHREKWRFNRRSHRSLHTV